VYALTTAIKYGYDHEKLFKDQNMDTSLMDSLKGTIVMSDQNDWTREKVFSQGTTAVEITSKINRNGDKIYSILAGRKSRNRDTGEEFLSRFMQPEDVIPCSELLEDADEWIEKDRANSPIATPPDQEFNRRNGRDD
jgi:hypothetical protein